MGAVRRLDQRGQTPFRQAEPVGDAAEDVLAQGAGGSRQVQGRNQLGDRPVPTLGASRVGPVQDAIDVKLHKRHRLLDARAQRLGPLMLNQLRWILALGQRNHTQLQIAADGQPGRPQHGVLAGSVGVKA